MRTTFEISETIAIEACIEPAEGYVMAVEGAHANPTHDQLRRAARGNAETLGKDLEDLGYVVSINRAEREVDALRRRLQEERSILQMKMRAEMAEERCWEAEVALDGLAEEARRMQYRARVHRFKANRAARLLRR